MRSGMKLRAERKQSQQNARHAATRRLRRRPWSGGESLEARQLLAGDLVGYWQADQNLVTAAGSAVLTEWTDIVAAQPTRIFGSPELNASGAGGRAMVSFDATDGNDGVRVASANNPLGSPTDFSVAFAFQTTSRRETGTK